MSLTIHTFSRLAVPSSGKPLHAQLGHTHYNRQSSVWVSSQAVGGEPATVLWGTSILERGLKSPPHYRQAGMSSGILGSSWGFRYRNGAHGQVRSPLEDGEGSLGSQHLIPKSRTTLTHLQYNRKGLSPGGQRQHQLPGPGD